MSVTGVSNIRSDCVQTSQMALPRDDCSFAHGEHELRSPWISRCVRVVKHGSKLMCIGCNSTEHTFRRCPIHPRSPYLVTPLPS